MQIVPGIHQHHVDLGIRDLFVYSVHGEQTILVDSGLVSTPTGVIEPDLQKFGITLGSLNILVNTHADADHVGGNHEIRLLAPHAPIFCHKDDVDMVNDPECLMIKRYDQFHVEHGISYDQPVNDFLRSIMSPILPRVSLGLNGGEVIYVDTNRSLTVLHTPGHSFGHISLYDPVHKLAFTGDCVLGQGLVTHSGTLAAPPTYLDVDSYLGTIQLLEFLSLHQMYTCHFNVLEGEDVFRFLADSKKFVVEFEQLLNVILESRNYSWTMQELLYEISLKMDHYAFQPDFAFPVTAHMTKKVRLGLFETVWPNGRMAWRRR